MKETMTVDIKGFSAPFGDPSKKGKKKKKPWYLQDKESIKESVLGHLHSRKIIAESNFESLMKNAQGGASLASLIKHNKDVLYRVFKKDESQLDDGERALISQLKKTYGEDKIQKKMDQAQGKSSESEGKPKEEPSKEPKSKEDEDFEREQKAAGEAGEKRKQEIASRLHVPGEKAGVSKDFAGQKKEKTTKEKDARHGLTDLAVGMASGQAEKILPTYTQIEQTSPNFASQLAQAYERKVGRKIAKDFNKWATVFNDKVVGEIKDFKEKHGLKTKKFEPGTVKAKGAQFTKPRVKQKDQKKLSDPTMAGKRSVKKFDSIDSEIQKQLKSKGQVTDDGETYDEMGKYTPGSAEKSVRNVLARYELDSIGDDDLFDRRVKSFASSVNMNPQRLFDFIEVFNRMKDDEEAGDLKPAKMYFREMDITPWDPAELENFHDFLDSAEPAYPPQRALKSKMDAPEDSEEGLSMLNALAGPGSNRGLPRTKENPGSDLGRKFVSRKAADGVEKKPTDIEDFFGDVLKKHWGQEQTSDLGFKNPQLKKLMFKLFKDAASSGDKAIIPRDLLPVKAMDEEGNAVIIRSLPDLVKFTTGGTKGSSKMADQFEEFLIDFSNDYPSHFAALREKTVQVAKKVMPQEMESDESLRAKDSGIKEKDRKMWKGDSKPDSFTGIKGLSGPVPSYKKKGSFDRPPHEEDVEDDVSKLDDFGEKASQLKKMSKAGVYTGGDLSSLKSLMGKFLPKRSSEPSDEDLEEIESENDFDMSKIVKKASDNSDFDMSRLDPRAVEKTPLARKRKERKEKMGLGKIVSPKMPGEKEVEKPKDDFDFEDMDLKQDLSTDPAPKQKMSSQSLEDDQVQRSLDTMVEKIIDSITGKLAKGDIDVATAMKALRNRLTKMDRWDKQSWDYIKEKVKEKKGQLRNVSLNKIKAGQISKLPYKDEETMSALRQMYPVQTPLNLKKKEIPESLTVIDGSEFTPTTQNKKGWENGKLSKKKKFEPTKTPSLKKALSIVLLGDGDGEDCDD